MAEILASLNNVTKTFHQKIALSNITLQLNAGEMVCIAGADGVGKTTLLRLLAGLLIPDSGTITVCQIPLPEKSTRLLQENIGYLPQQFGLYEELTVVENLNLHTRLAGYAAHELNHRCRELLQIMRLNTHENKRAGDLSGGMKQKLSLACVLLQRPKLLLLDEPTVGVDPFSRLELWELLNSIKSEDIGIIITTTTMEEAKYCDRLIFLHQNTILKDSQPLELLEQYKQQTFLVTTEKQTLRELQQQLKTIPGIMSTLIRGQFLRLLLSKPSTLNEFAKLLPNDCHITESQANYDDAFVASVKHIEKRLQVTTYDSPAIAATDAVVVNDIFKCFGTRTVVNHISFSIKRGEIFGLLGANGAGKTTTFKMICGLLPMASGEIQIAGISLTKDSVRARSRIGYVAQKFSLYAELTVIQNLEFFCNVYNMIDSKKIVQQTLENFSLQEFKNQCSGQLPYGIQRRLSMACALMHEPAIIFLDEPTSGVDPFGRRDFWDNIQALVARGVTVLITTHHLEEAEYCDRIGLLHQGNLILQGPPIAIRTQISKQLQRECTLEEAFINLIQQQEAVDVT